MEQASYRLTTGISRRRDAHIIAWGGSQRYLPVFAMVAFFRALAIGLVHGVDLIHVGDPVLGALGYVLGRILRVPIVVTVHGLDVIYPHWLYQFVTSRILRRCDAVIAISRAAHEECIKRGVRVDHCFVVTLGVDPPASEPPERKVARSRLDAIYRLDLAERDVLLTTGRLVRRKGVAWFVDDVLPKIVQERPETMYLVVGVGPEEARIRTAIERNGLSSRVRLLGKVENDILWAAYRASDLFVMPNRVVLGDMEGFGLVAIEAGLASCYVVATDIEGIRDAVHPPANGKLLPAGDSVAFAETIAELLSDRCRLDDLGRAAQQFVLERFGWTRTIDEYLRIFDDVRKRAAQV